MRYTIPPIKILAEKFIAEIEFSTGQCASSGKTDSAELPGGA
jgi:hypothetical protein